MATISAVCMSRQKGTRKVEVDSAEIAVDHGLVGDAHAGSGRQVSLLALESIELMKKDLPTLVPGDFAENLTTTGISINDLKIGTQLKVGEAILLEVTQIGKKCHSKCDIFKQVGYCIMPTQGVFAKVLTGGTVRKGDPVEILG